MNYLEEISKFYINNAKDTKDIPIDDFAIIITKVVTTYEALFKKKWAKELARAKTFSNNSGGGHSYNNTEEIYEKKEVFDSSGSEDYKKLLCRYHPRLNNHSEKNCLLSPNCNSRINKARKKFGPNVRIRHKYKALNFKPGHKECKQEDLQKMGKKVEKSIVSIELDAVDDDMDTDEDDYNESKMSFASLSIEDKKDCKLDAVDNFFTTAKRFDE